MFELPLIQVNNFMGWKNWPYWLKGGIIGLILMFALPLILIISSFGFNCNSCWNALLGLSYLATPILLPILFIISRFDGCTGEACIGRIIFVIPALMGESFIIGAIIGLIAGKIKNKKTA
jgi:hypothetical protein